MNIADAKTKYFEDKDHYLEMRKAWADSVNDSNTHLKAEHFMFYNAIRGKDITCGFTETKSLKKIYYQGWINLAQDNAHFNLKRAARRGASEIVDIFDGQIDAGTVQQVIADMPSIPQKMENSRYLQRHGCGNYPFAFDEWALEYQLKQFGENLIANQTPLEPEFREVLNQVEGGLL